MSTYIIPIFALSLIHGASAGDDSSASGWDDFANNFATDIAPIVVLFGEQVTKQFLSESTSALDHVIFAVAPLGVLTAVVSVIRVCGSSSLKAFIGRAQEAHGISEAELCSSTSRDVCELWSNGGISRIFGRPEILEFIFSGRKDFYIKFPKSEPGSSAAVQDGEQDCDKIQHPSCGIHKPKAFFCHGEFEDDGASLKPGSNWKEVKNTFSPSSRPSTTSTIEPDQKGAEHPFAPHPNLSLNVGIRPPPRWVQWAVAIFGALLQLSFFGYATWASYYASDIWEDGKPPQKWAFPLAVTGTSLLVIGMGLCATLIDRRTHERRFEKIRSAGRSEKIPPQTPKTTMFWLQPGNQSVGDQVFNSFAHWEKKDEYVTSWRVDGFNPFTTIFAIVPAITFSTLGFILQFIGLRGLHGSVALYQLAATLIMAFIRAALRSKRIDEGKNRLKDRREVEGHELDWIALQIESAAQENDRNTPTGGASSPSLQPNATDTNRCCIWYIVDTKPTQYPQASGITSSGFTEVEILPPGLKDWQNMIGFCPKPGSDKYACARGAIEWIESHEKDKTDSESPNKAARILHYRRRLARLTDSITPEQERPWDGQVRTIAGKLKRAIEATARHIFSSEMSISDEWKNAGALVWSSTCRLNAPGEPAAGCFPIHFLLYRENGQWTISQHQLEAVLGLWQWSLKTQTGSRKFFDKKVLAITEESKKDSLKSMIRLWISQDLIIDDAKFSYPLDPKFELQSVLSVAALTSSQPGPKNQAMLSIPSTASPLELIARDIFTMFISRISEVIEPLKGVEPRIRKSQGTFDLSMPSEKPFLGLSEPNIEILVERYIASGLGTREDALVSMIPSLLHKQKLPVPEEVGRRAVQKAQAQRRNGDYQNCEDILKGLLQLQDPKIEALALRGLGELYRSAIRSQKDQDRELGHRIGVELGNMSCLSPEANDIQQHYKEAIQYFENIRNNPLQTHHNLDIGNDEVWKALEHNLDHKKPGPLSLLLTANYNISNSSGEKLSKVIKWAIKNNSPELIEDLWKVAGSQSTNLWRGFPVSSTGNPLLWAVEFECEPETFQSIIEWPGAKIEERAVDGGTAFLEAAKRNLPGHMRALLKAGADFNAQLPDGSNALHIATAKGSYEVVELLLDKGVDVNAENKSEELRGTAIHIAASKGHLQIVELLLNRGVDTKICDKALVEAAAKDFHGIADLLLSRDIDKITIDNSFEQAAVHGHCEVLRLLLKKGATLVAVEDGFRKAILGGHYQVVEFLLSKGVTNAAIGNGLKVAASLGSSKITKLLLESGADIDTSDTNIALLNAISKGHLPIAELLLTHGANPNTQGDYGNALNTAVSNLDCEMIKVLLNNGADINAINQDHGTALYVAARMAQANPDVIKLLLNFGAEINAQGGEHGYALSAAVGSNNKDIVELLLSSGADVNAQGGEYGCALITAVHNKNESITELLLAFGADANAQGGEYGNALNTALFWCHTGIARLLLKSGADVNSKSGKHGNALTIVLYRVAIDKKEMVELLLDLGANVNAQGGEHGNVLNTALHWGHVEIARRLIESGADVNAQGGVNGNALNTALETNWSNINNTEMFELLMSFGVDINAQGGEYGNALNAALYRGRLDIARQLIESGVDVNAQGGKYGNALNSALISGKKNTMEMAKLLLGSGAQVNAQGGMFGNALSTAALARTTTVFKNDVNVMEVVGFLLEHGANINLKGGFYGNLLQSAASGGDPKLIELLLSRGLGINARGGKCGNALNAAIVWGHAEVLQILLDCGAKIATDSFPYDYERVKVDERKGYVHRKIIELLSKGFETCRECESGGLRACNATRESCRLNWIHKAGLEDPGPPLPSEPAAEG
ncbi:hypothetical protein TWF788_000761 [Orbilia oligospora]|uniref:Uncharacterized protein n=1 Tax=Orbilia oligospora TaxID=2813651 RepID=A0A7C8P3N3_ORBOL|nr:hypothetical protein TWF788_000761 [Orbilia oligospora]